MNSESLKLLKSSALAYYPEIIPSLTYSDRWKWQTNAQMRETKTPTAVASLRALRVNQPGQ